MENAKHPEWLEALEQSTQRLCDFRSVQEYRGSGFAESVSAIKAQIAINKAIIEKAKGDASAQG